MSLSLSLFVLSFLLMLIVRFVEEQVISLIEDLSSSLRIKEWLDV